MRILHTQAVAIDPDNHIYRSNRSAAYLANGEAMPALEDARTCVEIMPDWGKGYVRLGAALHGLDRHREAADAYRDGTCAIRRGLARLGVVDAFHCVRATTQ